MGNIYIYIYVDVPLIPARQRQSRKIRLAAPCQAEPKQTQKKAEYFTTSLKVYCTQFANMWITQIHLVQVIRWLGIRVKLYTGTILCLIRTIWDLVGIIWVLDGIVWDLVEIIWDLVGIVWDPIGVIWDLGRLWLGPFGIWSPVVGIWSGSFGICLGSSGIWLGSFGFWLGTFRIWLRSGWVSGLRQTSQTTISGWRRGVATQIFRLTAGRRKPNFPVDGGASQTQISGWRQNRYMLPKTM